MADNKKIPAEKYGVTLLAVTIAEDYLQSGTMPEPITDDVTEREKAAGLPLTVITTDKAMEKEGEQVTKGRTIALDDAPELDPTNPQYDPQAYSKRLQELAEDIADTKAVLYASALESAGDALANLVGAAEMIKPQISNIIDALPNIVNGLQKALENLAGIDWELLPYISKEMDKPENKALLENCRTMKDLTKAPEWQAILEAARQAKAEDAEKENYNLKNITHHPIIKSRELALPFDPFNEVKKKATGVNGQITMLQVAADHKKPIVTGKGKNRVVRYERQELNSYYSINFAETLPPEIARSLDQIDALLYGAIDACMQTNGNIMTFAEVYRAMGYKRKPGEKEKQQILFQLQKMQGAFVYFDFSEEREVYKGSAGYENIGISWKNGTPLLHFETRQNILVNGQSVDDVIIILDPKLPLYKAAEDRGHQIADVPIVCLQVPFKKTNENLAMMFFTLQQISKMKDPKDTKTKNVLLYSTLFKKCGIPATGGTDADRQKRKRQKDTFFKYLEHLKKIEYIKGYKEKTAADPGEPGVEITLNAGTLPDKKAKV